MSCTAGEVGFDFINKKKERGPELNAQCKSIGYGCQLTPMTNA